MRRGDKFHHPPFFLVPSPSFLSRLLLFLSAPVSISLWFLAPPPPLLVDSSLFPWAPPSWISQKSDGCVRLVTPPSTPPLILVTSPRFSPGTAHMGYLMMDGQGRLRQQFRQSGVMQPVRGSFVCASTLSRSAHHPREKARQKAVVIRDANAQSEAVPRPGERAADPGWAFFVSWKREKPPPPSPLPDCYGFAYPPRSFVVRSLSMKLGCRTDGPLPSPLVIIHTNLPVQTAL